MSRPTLVVVAGPPGAGKTTFSRLLGDALGLPVVGRDAIKEGVTFTTGITVANGSPEASQMFDLFYEVVDGLLERGVSTIAEAAFRADIAPDELRARAGRADLVMVRCVVAEELWIERFRARGRRPGHRDEDFLARVSAEGGPRRATYLPVLPEVPTLDVDTTDGYDPDFDRVVAFVRAARGLSRPARRP